MESKHLLEIVRVKFQVNAAIFTAFHCISNLNIFSITWDERGALPDIQTSGLHGRVNLVACTGLGESLCPSVSRSLCNTCFFYCIFKILYILGHLRSFRVERVRHT